MWWWWWGVCCSVAGSSRGGPAAAVVPGVNEKLLGSKKRGSGRQRQRGKLLWAVKKEL